MFAQLTSLAGRIVARFRPEEGKEGGGPLQASFRTRSEDGWIPLARQTETPRYRSLQRGTSDRASRGSVPFEGKEIAWAQFDFPRGHESDGCRWHSVSWRFYRSGLVCLSAELGKDKSHLDPLDLLGHAIELRDGAGFVLGVWSAAFQVRRSGEPMAYQASVQEDFVPLSLHFDELADVQGGFWFRA